MSWEGSGALVWGAEQLRIATDAAGVALWSWNVDTDEIALDDRAYHLWSVVRDGPITFEDLSARIHPEDLNRVRTAFHRTRAIVGPYEIAFRILDGKQVRWISARGQGSDDGMVGRVMFGVFLDVTEHKQAEEDRELLAGEMSHRMKNLFTIASALTAIAARSATSTTSMARDLTQRLNALGRAHDLVRPIASRDSGRASLGELLSVLLAPYSDDSVGTDRVRVAVPNIPVGEASSTTLALIVHELATNSIKYGALSMLSGKLDISCTVLKGDIIILWAETGGPPATGSHRTGYGSKLLQQSVSGQLGGLVAFDWRPEGLVVTLRLNLERLAK